MGSASLSRLTYAVVASFAFVCAELAVTRAAGAQGCPGDCGGDGTVSIEDLIRGVNIALGTQPVANCTAMDSDGGGTVTIGELIRAVNSALRGCPPEPTATETAVSEDTATPTEEATATETTSAVDTATPPATETPPSSTPTEGPTTLPFCSLPGSVVSTVPGPAVVPGGPDGTPDLSFIQLPIGYCVHYFAKVGNVRQLRFSPSGDLFAASPNKFTTSNATGGRAQIVVLPDDDRDGTADSVQTYMSQLMETVGLLFTGGYLYYQDGYTGGSRIMRVPYEPGDRAPSGESEQVADLTGHSSFLHWPKALDVADDGTIYVTNGGDEGDPCPVDKPYRGAILKLEEGVPAGTLVAKGFRNPISLRCVRGKGVCFAIELTRDYSTPMGGREKLLPIRQGDDWGYPCCATKDTPYSDMPQQDCSGVAAEINSFFVGNTPFDLDYELGRWPEPWGNRAYVPVHGAYGSWAKARLVAIELDAMTGQVLPGSDLMGPSTGAMEDFATGWGPLTPQDIEETRRRGRPTVVAFAPDGRLFMGNDYNGDIIWIAPVGLAPPAEE